MRLRMWSRPALLAVLLAAVAVGCGGSADDREEIRAQNGEPDNTMNVPGPTADLEIWIYADYQGSGASYCYQFEQSRNVCGGEERWYLSAEGTGLCNLYFEDPSAGSTDGRATTGPEAGGILP
ncbi:MAG: hypothetical protein R6W82_00395 [bacterium]